MNTLVITPMQEEFDWFRDWCSRHGLQTEDSVAGRLPTVRLPDLGITLARGGVGKTQFALQTQHLLDTLMDVDWVICAGVAGALVDDLSIGDVVVGTTTVEHDYNNKFNDRPLPSFDGAPTAIAGLKGVSLPPDSFRVHFGKIASGDEDVVDTERRRALHKSTGALVVAWEGAGGARACAFSRVPFVEIRAVTDTADHNAPSDFEANLQVAMHNATTLITCWLNHPEDSQKNRIPHRSADL
jgi:adenosylhomocysteine nucleosidase